MKRLERSERLEGRLIEIDWNNKCGRVATGNDEIGILKIYFKNLEKEAKVDCTVEFEVVVSKFGNRYAKFKSLVERNQAVFNTEDRKQWYAWGENEENDFIAKIVPQLQVDIRRNPEKETYLWAIDLYDYTNNRPADLKRQTTPFFTAGKYLYGEEPYDPTYTVTFNRKDYENYNRNYSECDIYFGVDWQQLQYKNISVQKEYGVWRASFLKMVKKIKKGEVALHQYIHRVADDHNAKDSYLFDLRDTSIFERLI